MTQKVVKPISLGTVAYIADWVAPTVGISTVILIPAITLLLCTAAKMGVKAYCSTKQFD